MLFLTNLWVDSRPCEGTNGPVPVAFMVQEELEDFPSGPKDFSGQTGMNKFVLY